MKKFSDFYRRTQNFIVRLFVDSSTPLPRKTTPVVYKWELIPECITKKIRPSGRFFLCISNICSIFAGVMLLYPNCKINIGLRIVRKRPDGYHDLETIFVPTYGLHDELEVIKNDEMSAATPLNDGLMFVQEGIKVDCPAEDNLIVKCYRAMAAKYPQIGAVSVRFKKNIPFGAGLGGGSSDAAHMAIALNELFGLGLSKAQLAEEVRPLGADCPFFIYNTPVMPKA